MTEDAGDGSLTEITEGKTSVLVPSGNLASDHGPGTKESGASFFNPAMEQNRDLSVLMTAVEVQRRLEVGMTRAPISYLDGLSASGIRGIRMDLEANLVEELPLEILCNDWDLNSFHLILKNIEHSGAQNTFATNENLSMLMLDHRFDMVDVDPFGTPVPFIDAAVRAVKDHGILSVTATDTAALCGASVKACDRKYHARPVKTAMCHETAIRILAGYVQRIAGTHERALTPILSYSSDHFVRVYFRVRKGAGRSDEVLGGQGLIAFDSDVEWKLVDQGFQQGSAKKGIAGPMWLGPLHDKAMLKRIHDMLQEEQWQYLGAHKVLSQLVERMLVEVDLGPLFYETNELARHFSTSPVGMDVIKEQLEKEGFLFCRASIDPNGFRTDATLDVLEKIYMADPTQK